MKHSEQKMVKNLSRRKKQRNHSFLGNSKRRKLKRIFQNQNHKELKGVYEV